MFQLKNDGKDAWPDLRNVGLLACGGVLVDRVVVWPTIEGPAGELWWSGRDLERLMSSAYLKPGRPKVSGFCSETSYTLTEQGRQAIHMACPNWQQILQRPVSLRLRPGGQQVIALTLASIVGMWMESPYDDRNTYLCLRYQQHETTGQGIALKQDNAVLFREGIFADPSTNALGKKAIPNPYILLAQGNTRAKASHENEVDPRGKR